MSRVTVYTTRHCPYRVSDKRLLSRKGVDPIEIDGVQSPESLAQMLRRSGRRNVLQREPNAIFVKKCCLTGG